MKKGINQKRPRLAMRLMAIATIFSTTFAGTAWGANPLPLSQIPVPEPPNLSQFVKNKAAAIKLGKALFWDVQVGSDGLTACASCHYKAGADPIFVRAKNQVHPGPDSVFNVGTGANYTLQAADFPFLQVSPVDARIVVNPTEGIVTRNVNDVGGSQGVFKTQFTGVVLGSAVEGGTPLADALFNVGGVNVRQVTGRNTPPAVNAVFNYANFWDGRASNIFNGSSPIGPLDPNSGIWLDSNGTLVKVNIAIPNASLASQAVGPPLSDVEMSFIGRTWPDIGRKMLSLSPLATQFVHPADSVLGPLSNAVLQPNGTLGGAKGINATYVQMIKDAFQDGYWNSVAITPTGFTQMEANFSLFWGLAVQLYEATLVSDQTPFDRFLAGDTTAMSPAAQSGFNIFQSQCATCHSGSELSNATVSTAAAVGNLVEAGATGVNGAISDVGFSNIGVRPTAEDIGRGGIINFPLSFAAQAAQSLPFALFPLPNGVPANPPVAVNGAFKTPQLRNVELTPPFMHNGSMFTLDEVVEFYARGGNFPNPEMDTQMNPIGTLIGNPAKRAEVVEFLLALTDPRVKNDAAPFDHPELPLPNGIPESPATMVNLPATGTNGQILTVNMTTDKPSPQVINVPGGITFTANVQGGNTGLQYRFWLRSATGAWSVARAYGPNPSWTWNATTAVPGSYFVQVDVRRLGSQVAREGQANTAFRITPVPATGVTLTPQVSAPQAAGTQVIFDAAGIGGTGPLEYRFWVKSGGTWSVARNYSAVSSWQWDTTGVPAGTYAIQVDVRNAGTSVQRDAAKAISYQITTPPVASVTLQSNPAGTQVAFNAAGTGGSGSYEYRFWLKTGSNWSVVQSYTPSPTWIWDTTTAAPGTYGVQVDVRNAGSTSYRDAVKAIPFTVP